jgi:hypothetical protein
MLANCSREKAVDSVRFESLLLLRNDLPQFEDRDETTHDKASSTHDDAFLVRERPIRRVGDRIAASRLAVTF